jgi:hypothetical protein
MLLISEVVCGNFGILEFWQLLDKEVTLYNTHLNHYCF